MIRACFECDAGALFNTETLEKYGLDVGSVWPRVVARQPPTPEVFRSSVSLSGTSKIAENLSEELADIHDASANMCVPPNSPTRNGWLTPLVQ